ncbi:hypothetical protein VU06_01540, partial [Desulfobulbus sp. F3]|nr:hypothetical protein [Desulfobulbus sp. F3]
ENDRIAALRGPDDWLLFMPERSGPLGLLRRGEQIAAGNEELPVLAAGLVVRYGQKNEDGIPMPADVRLERDGGAEMLCGITPLQDIVFQEWAV